MSIPTLKTVAELVDLAWIYADDGALRTAAERLSEAADQLEEIAERRDADLELMEDSK